MNQYTSYHLTSATDPMQMLGSRTEYGWASDLALKSISLAHRREYSKSGASSGNRLSQDGIIVRRQLSWGLHGNHRTSRMRISSELLSQSCRIQSNRRRGLSLRIQLRRESSSIGRTWRRLGTHPHVRGVMRPNITAHIECTLIIVENEFKKL